MQGDEATTVLMSINLTSLQTHFTGLMDRLKSEGPERADLVCFQEHSLREELQNGLIGRARSEGSSMTLSPAAIEGSKAVGGVGSLARSRVHLQKCSLKHQDLVAYQAKGRIQLTLVDVGCPFPVRIANVYAWTDGERSAEARRATEHLFSSLLQDLQDQPEIPTIVLGGFSMSCGKIEPLKELLSKGTYLDVGAMEAFAGPDCDKPTCMAHNARIATRRDFIL
eukprot:6548245-Alexandrium_andersonii.AAC.1